MIITCPECRTRFRLADERIGAAGRRVRCAVCRTVFTAAGPPPPVATPIAEPVPDSAEEAGIGIPAAAADWQPEEEMAPAPAPEADAEEDDAPLATAAERVAVEEAAELAVETAAAVVADVAAGPEAAAVVEEVVAAAEDFAPPERTGELLPPLAERRRSPWGRLLLLLLIAAAAAFFTLTPDGRALWSRFRAAAGGSTQEHGAVMQVALEGVVSSYLEHPEAGQLLIVRGSAANRSGEPRAALAVKAVLSDADGRAIGEQGVFCGSALTDEALLAMTAAGIDEAMTSRRTDADVPPGSALPFTIVFRSPPATMANINVEVTAPLPAR